MKIILIEDINKLGAAGDVVKVANGYARNYLLPQKKAILAIASNLKKVVGIQTIADEKRVAKLIALKEMAAKISGLSLEFVCKTDDQGTLYGSVAEVDITNALNNMGHVIKKSMLKMENHYKSVGEYTLNIRLSAEVDADIKVVVKSENPIEMVDKKEEEAVIEEPAETVATTSEVEEEIQAIEESEAIN